MLIYLLNIVVALIRAVLDKPSIKSIPFDLLGGSVLGDGFGAFGYGVLGQFSGEEKSDSGLDFPRGDGGPLVVVGKTGSFSSNALEDVIDKGVHDAHGLGGYTGIGVNLLQYLVDVDGIGFLPFAVFLLVRLGNGLCGLSCLLGGFSRYFWWHVESLDE